MDQINPEETVKSPLESRIDSLRDKAEKLRNVTAFNVGCAAVTGFLTGILQTVEHKGTFTTAAAIFNGVVSGVNAGLAVRSGLEAVGIMKNIAALETVQAQHELQS